MTIYVVSVLINIVIVMIAAIGLNVQFGWGGQLNLAYFTFFAIGAYVLAVVTLGRPTPDSGESYILGLGLPWIVGVAAAVVTTVLLGLGLGFVALSRALRADYFAIVTLAAFQVVNSVVTQQTNLFDGAQGLYGIPQPLPFITTASDSYAVAYLGICVVILALIYWSLSVMIRRPFGRALRALREDEAGASAFGISAVAVQLKAFVLGAGIAGLSGALFVTYLTIIDPSSWSIGEEFLLLIGIILGGTGNLRGVLLGVFLVVGVFTEGLRLLPEIPSHVGAINGIENMALGVLIIVVLRWRPEGILPEPVSYDLA